MSERLVADLMVERLRSWDVDREQRENESQPRFPDGQEIPDFPYAGYAELLA